MALLHPLADGRRSPVSGQMVGMPNARHRRARPLRPEHASPDLRHVLRGGASIRGQRVDALERRHLSASVRGLEQLDRIAVGILELYLLAARACFQLIAE